MEPPTRPSECELPDMQSELPEETMMVFRQFAKDKIGAFKMTLTPVAEVRPTDISDTNTWNMIWKRRIQDRVLFNGETSSIQSAMWRRGSAVVMTYLMDVVTWRALMCPFYDDKTKSIVFQHADRPAGYKDSGEDSLQRHFNFKLVLRPENFGCHKFLLVAYLNNEDISPDKAASTVYYLYAAKQPDSGTKMWKMYIPPMCNHFDDGKVCIRPDIGARNINTDPDKILMDLENAPGNLHLYKSNSPCVTAKLLEKDYMVGEEPYLIASCPMNKMISVSPTIPPVWNLF